MNALTYGIESSIFLKKVGNWDEFDKRILLVLKKITAMNRISDNFEDVQSLQILEHPCYTTPAFVT